MADIGGNRAGRFFFFFCQSLIWPSPIKLPDGGCRKLITWTLPGLVVCWPSTDPRSQAWVWTADFQRSMAFARPSRLRVHREEQHEQGRQPRWQIRLRFNACSWPWIHKSRKQLHYLLAVLELSFIVHDPHQQIEFGQFSWNCGHLLLSALRLLLLRHQEFLTESWVLSLNYVCIMINLGSVFMAWHLGPCCFSFDYYKFDLYLNLWMCHTKYLKFPFGSNLDN